MQNKQTPKFKIGENVCVSWVGGHTTKQIITGIKETERGFWYTWEPVGDFGSGLHEHHLSKVYEEKTE